MQTTSLGFRQLAAGHVRPLSWDVRVSFDKTFDDAITFFTLDTSVLDGPDLLAPSDDNPLQLWDKYSYADYTDRTVSIEVTREEMEPYSIAQAYADVTFNNYDNYFTPNSGSPIETTILPRRPFRALLGFGGEVLPQIVGLSEGMPQIDKSSRTASFHVIDFMSYLLDQDISETIILQDVTTAEVLDYLFQFMGLLDTQYSLDDSLNTIKFFYVEKGTKFKTVADKLMEAEIGRLYLDEAGVIRFRNRYNYESIPVYTFDKSNVIDYSVSNETQIINSVKVTSRVREVQLPQSIWTSAIPIAVQPGATVVIWAEFLDPVTSATAPAYSALETNDSYFISTLSEDGTGAYTDMTIVMELFSKSAKLTIENIGASPAYVTAIDIYGTPAKVVDTIKVEEVDQSSIDKYEEQLHEIDNEYIQDESNAQSRALILIHDYAEYGATVDIDVKGNPAIQLGDPVVLDLDGYQGVHIVTKTTNLISEGKFTQRLRARKKTAVTLFTLDASVLDGTDLLGP
jgi:hypothetical protein